MKIKKIFISYSQDSPDQLKKVASFANRLRLSSIDANIDQFYVSPEEGWPLWMQNQIDTSDFVLCVCSAQYKQKFEGRVSSGFGKGVAWEGLIATQIMYERNGKNTKFIPILIDGESPLNIPLMLRPFTYFSIPRDFEKLVQHINGVSISDFLQIQLQEQEIKSRGLPRIIEEMHTADSYDGKVTQTVLSPMSATLYTNPIISTKGSKEYNVWNNIIHDNINIISDSGWVMPLQPFIILIEENTKEPISLVAQAKLRITEVLRSSTSVVANQKIATIEFEKGFKGIPWTISRGTAYGGVLKYRPRLEDKIWKQFLGFHNESGFQIVSHSHDSDNGINYIKAPTAGILTEISINSEKIGQKLEQDEVIGHIQRGEALFPIRTKNNCVFIEQVTRSFEAVHVNQSIIKVRESPSIVNLILKLSKSYEHEELFELAAPIAGKVKFSGQSFIDPLEPGANVVPGIILCSIITDDIIVNLSIDYSGKLLEVVGENNRNVSLGDVLMRFSVDRLFIRSPVIGTFYRAKEPGKPPLVEIGDVIKAGDVIYVVENIKLFHEFESEFNGVIESIEVDDCSPVEYGQKLFGVKLIYDKNK